MIKVYGFPRSGNHLLMEMLARNFYPDADLETPGGEVGHWADRQTVGPVEFGKLAGHHGPPEWGIEQPAIYVFRDGRAVAASLWKSPHFKRPLGDADWWERPNVTFSDFVRFGLDWFYTPSQRALMLSTPIEHWKHHLGLWDGAGAMRMRYENLVQYPLAMLERIQARFGYDRPKVWHIPYRLVGHFPSGGTLDGWRELWTDEDQEYFFSIVPRDFYGVCRDDEG